MHPALLLETLIPIVCHAARIIREKRFSFITETRRIEANGCTEPVTNAELLASAHYQHQLHDLFPEHGILCAEERMCVPAKDTKKGFFTMHPLDGAATFAHKYAHGFATSLSLVQNGRVVLAITGDVMTQELFAWHEQEKGIQHIDMLTLEGELIAPPALSDVRKPLRTLLRNSFHDFDAPTRRVIETFLGSAYEVQSHALTLSAHRVFTGERDALLLSAGTLLPPWEANPLIGTAIHSGFVFIRMPHETSAPLVFRQEHVRASTHPLQLDAHMLIMHASHLPAFWSWCYQNKYLVTR